MDHSEKIIRKPNPREKANVFSLLTFLYTRKLFGNALKKDLEEDDLYEVIKSCQSKRCGDKIERKFFRDNEDKKVSIERVLWRTYGKRYILLGVIHLCFKLVTSVLEPEAIGKLVSYFKPKQTLLTLQDAIYYAGIMIGLKMVHSFYFPNYMIYIRQMTMEMRTAFCSLIYKKTLKLTPQALSQVTLGHIVTIITKDVLQFEHTIWPINEMWTDMVQTFVICYLLYNKIGVSSLVGVGMFGVATVLQIYIGGFIKSMRLNINKKTDERLQITQESLSSIRIIKMYTWERYFGEKINEARKREIKQIVKTFYLKIIMILLSLLCSKVGFYSLIMTYIWLNNSASADVIFYVMKCFIMLKHTIAHSVSTGIAKTAEFSASLNRINNILNAEELDDTIERPASNPEIHMKDVTVMIKEKPILQNISLNFKNGLNVLTGPLGCGKSSLIKTILNDFPIDEGIIESNGRRSYASQDPWLFPSSIRQNILFGDSYDKERYHEVVRVCALQYDFSLFDKGDETIVSDRGLNLSKGQQARINLARAIYKESDIYLIDDSLTALDSQVQDFIFNECIRGFLKDKLVLLVTHNFKHINVADKLTVMDHGTIKFDGKEQDLSKDILKAIKEEEIKEKNTTEEDSSVNESTKLLSNDIQIKRRGVYHEVKKEGSVDTGVYSSYFKFGGGLVLFSFIVISYAVSQFTDSYCDKLLTNWVNIQQNITSFRELKPVNLPGIIENVANNSTPEKNLDYIAPEPLIALPNNSVWTGVYNSLEINQTNFNIRNLKNKSDKTLNMYSFTIFAFIIWELLKHWLILKFAKNASVRLHRAMMHSMLFSRMSFFDNHFIGNILNRFIQDLAVLDERLPFLMSRLVGTLFAVGGIIILIAVVNWRFFIPALALVIFLVLVRSVYMPAARSLKRLESATRSPMIGHLNSSMEGLTTIRAYKAQDILIREFYRHQDLYTSAHYTLFCLKRAFSFYMDFSSLIFVSIIVGRFLFFDVGTASGDVGLAITQATALSMIIQGGLMNWSDLENCMTSVERVLEYTQLDKETTSGIEIDQWPSKAEITYTNVSLTYSNTNEKVLNNINFVAKSRQKIGIVGRTGAGKSSIISTLFRLYKYEGQIFIDGVDIKTLSLDFLRKHISIIPQDPIMFAGTVRSNIDPLQIYTDDEIWKTLHKIQLEDIIPSLDFEIKDNTSNFSTGQRQLICLARAIIRKNKIVVLDEATANMDPETDFLIQKAITDNFSNCTVIIIAHRLQSIVDCDQVIVMEKGFIVEHDSPVALMKNKHSMFSKMLKNAGL